MTTYQCLDGPLAGQVVHWRRLPPADRPLTVTVLDVEHGELAVDYRLEDAGRHAAHRHLRFVGTRDVHRPRRGLRRLIGR